MKTNVSTLLREFPKIRRAALAGEEVIVETREGNLKIVAECASEEGLLGAMKGMLVSSDNRLDQPTTVTGDWEPSL